MNSQSRLTRIPRNHDCFNSDLNRVPEFQELTDADTLQDIARIEQLIDDSWRELQLSEERGY